MVPAATASGSSVVVRGRQTRRAMSWQRRLLQPVLWTSTALMAGCAAGVSSGVSPQSGVSSSGYVLTAQEAALDCSGLTFRIEQGLARMDVLADTAAAESASPPGTMQRMLGRMFGGGSSGLAAAEDYERQASMVAAFATAASAKSCAPVDVAGRAAVSRRKIMTAVGRSP